MRILARLLFAATAMLAASSAVAKTYVAGIEPSFPPWASVERGQFVGIGPDAVRAIAKQQGFDVTFRSMSFSSLIPALKAGKIDMVVTGLTVTPERAKQIDFTLPWWQIKLDVLVPPNSDLTADSALGNGHTVGVQTGTTNYDYLKQLVAQGKDIDIKTYEQGTTALQDLGIGRIDAQFLDDDTAQQFLADNPGRMKIAGQITPQPPQVYALGVAKGNTALLKQLNAGEVAISKSGQWAKIVHKYMPDAQIAPIPVALPQGIDTYQKPIPGLSP
ncbi:transporter substrate-binding domain-containing protein [Salinisphaera sp. Q1T1-3]|uniref:transporter substrate-binding domain-containing protein n=1 Tax=Salinisphaera sp. Q1T1-3 TaxID=2321229 RepID=UPI001314A04E|nr:transporter substrate-binding domain-containing protein [Salinisphaera sp. Q1T1-3]